MAAVKKTVELFYDVVSPYSWLAFEVLTRYKTKWNMDLKLRPFLLGAVFQKSGNTPPMMVIAKGAYSRNDLHRLRSNYQVPLGSPSDFVAVVTKGTLKPQRFLTSINAKYPEYTEKVSRELWMRVWNKDVDITTPESLREAAKTAGLSEVMIDDALMGLDDQAIKDTLKKTTEEALELGAFGAPTLIAHVNGKKEMFFGADRFHLLADALGETYEGPLRELAASKL